MMTALQLPFRPPITPRQHTAIDYFQSAALAAAPELLGLTGVTARVVRGFGLMQGWPPPKFPLGRRKKSSS